MIVDRQRTEAQIHSGFRERDEMIERVGMAPEVHQRKMGSELHRRDGSRTEMGTPFRRASEEGLIIKGHSAHVGIRGPLYSRQDLVDDETLGFTIVHCRDLDRLGIDAIVERIHTRVGEMPVYVSVDVDVLDPAFAPGTGTPEAGGMTSRELLGILRGLADLRIVGGDVVEVAPAYDHAEITSVAASAIAYEMITMMAARLR